MPSMIGKTLAVVFSNQQQRNVATTEETISIIIKFLYFTKIPKNSLPMIYTYNSACNNSGTLLSQSKNYTTAAYSNLQIMIDQCIIMESRGQS